MPQIINTNIASLTAQRNLNTSQTALQIAMQRLSSGLRINSAKDDAAGLAIASRFTTQINGLNQAVRNANDGISLSQTGDAAMNEITNNLQRIRELAVQAANATNSASDRAALDQEVQQRIAEIDRIASQTSFNGQKILDGTFGTAAFQVGANVGETITVGLNTSMKSASIGSYVNEAGDAAVATATVAGTNGTATVATDANFASTGVNTYGAAGAYKGVDSGTFDGTNFQLNGTDVNDSSDYVGADTTYQNAASAYAKAAAINASGIAGVTATANTTLTFGTSGGTDSNGTDFLSLFTANAAGTVTMNYTLTINGQDVLSYNPAAVAATAGATAATSTNGVSMASVVDNINAYSDTTGVVATKTEDGNLQLVAADGRSIEIQEAISGLDGNVAADKATVQTAFSKLAETAQGTAASVTNDVIYRGQVTLQSSSSVTFTSNQTYAGFAGTTTELTASDELASQGVLTVSAANDTILAVDSALTAVSNLRSTFGAIQNRFESTIANLQTISENLSASRSRIQDADFAAETAAMTRGQILQQAGTAILAQANALPNNVLTLLR